MILCWGKENLGLEACLDSEQEAKSLLVTMREEHPHY